MTPPDRKLFQTFVLPHLAIREAGSLRLNMLQPHASSHCRRQCCACRGSVDGPFFARRSGRAGDECGAAGIVFRAPCQVRGAGEKCVQVNAACCRPTGPPSHPAMVGRLTVDLSLTCDPARPSSRRGYMRKSASTNCAAVSPMTRIELPAKPTEAPPATSARTICWKVLSPDTSDMRNRSTPT